MFFILFWTPNGLTSSLLPRIKLNLVGYEEEEDDDDEEEETVGGEQLSPDTISLHKTNTTTLEISMISSDGYKSRHSQPDCGYPLEPSRWTEYTIKTMDPDNLELTFEFFEVRRPVASCKQPHLYLFVMTPIQILCFD